MKNFILISFVLLSITVNATLSLPVELSQEEIQNFSRGLKVAFINSTNLGLIICEGSGTLRQDFNIADAVDAMSQVTTDVPVFQALPFDSRTIHAFIPVSPKYGYLEMSLVLIEKDTQIKSLEILNRGVGLPNNNDPMLNGNIIKGRVAVSPFVGRLNCQSTIPNKETKNQTNNL